MHKTHSDYSLAEEVFHAISHGAGVILSIAGLSWMLYVSIEAADPCRLAALFFHYGRFRGRSPGIHSDRRPGSGAHA